jgi:hypothetical protein
MKSRRPRTNEEADFVALGNVTDSSRVGLFTASVLTMTQREDMAVASIFPEVLTDTIQTETKDIQALITQVRHEKRCAKDYLGYWCA